MQTISAYIDSRLENINQFLNGFENQPNEINMDNPEPEGESVNIPLVSPFLDLNDDSDNGEVLSELEEYGSAGRFRRTKIINNFDRDDLAFQCMIGFRKFVAYFDSLLPMNIITRKAYNTIMVNGLKSTRMNLVAIVRDVCIFIGSFTFVTDFVVLEDIGEFILREMAEVVMGKPLREVTKLDYDCAKGLVSFTRIFDNYTFQMPRTIPSILQELTNRIACGNFFQENECEVFTEAGDGFRIIPDGISFGAIGIHGSIYFAEEWGRKVKSLPPYLFDSLHKMTIKEVKGESVIEWKTKVKTKDGIVIKFPGKFHGYKLATEDEVKENEGLKEVWEQIEYVISDSDSDLESTASS
ncbi:hypothetical protein Tco_1301794 [Tanacetum coccineum]